jgi:hypothetical protein
VMAGHGFVGGLWCWEQHTTVIAQGSRLLRLK